MLRHANWGLNAFPILKPALNSSYDKISGKVVLNQGIYVNKHVCEDLLWFAHSVDHLDGVCLFEAEEWSAHEADIEVWSDASKDGLGFWAPKRSCAFFSDPVLAVDLSFNIFLNEAFATLAAIHWASTLHPIPSHLAIHTDSSNSFHMFNSLHASDPYNLILMSTVSIRIENNIDLRVFFIEGKQNIITDALSHHSFNIVCKLAPDASIQRFMPLASPNISVMGAHQK